MVSQLLRETTMASQDLSGNKVAIFATDGFEQSELTDPKKALEQAGAEVHVISLISGRIRGWSKSDWSDSVDVDLELSKAVPDHYDALMLPGGVINSDRLRMDPKAIEFVKAFVDAGKPIAAICHGPQILIEADAVRGRRMTSWPSLKTDLENAGADWVDRAVVTDKGLVTSRKPDDIPAFNRKMIEEIAEGKHTPARRIRSRHVQPTSNH
jgi:protease I